MRVKVLTAFAETFRVHNPGDETDLPDDIAVAMLAAGAVERMEPAPEAAVMPARGERAVRFRPVAGR